MNQCLCDNESQMIGSTGASDLRVKVPPSVVGPASSNSSISSEEEAVIVTSMKPLTFVGKEVLTVSQSQVDTSNSTPLLKENNPAPPANVSVISTSSVGIKRKAEEVTPAKQSDHVPSIVNIVGKPVLPLHRNQRKKPKTDSIASNRQPVSVEKEESHSFLLASPEDSLYLNPLHCFVRRNIEIFVATATDIAAPCPGRKNSVVPGQVGLRCIHCRNVYSRNRTKRAVCYPSSITRVYHCVSDMKFDHFSNCKHLPQKERETFDTLKATCSSKKRGKKIGLGNFNTARYYRDNAAKLGLIDGPQNGIVTLLQPVSDVNDHSAPQSRPTSHQPLAPKVNLTLPKISIERSSKSQMIPVVQILPRNQNTSKNFEVPILHPPPALPTLSASSRCPPCSPKLPTSSKSFHKPNQEAQNNLLLAVPNDEAVLAPIHCFVRKNVEVFAATPEDVAAPAPGRKTRVTVGQIGLRCIHCANLSPKQRVKRAICYPPSIQSIYHSVSNMKFDHFGACKGLSTEAKQEFGALRASTNVKGGKKVNKKTTAQYYIDSAIQDLNLVNTETGIRFKENVQDQASLSKFEQVENNSITIIEEKTRNQSPTNGMSVLMMAATDPTMLEEYEKRKQFENLFSCAQSTRSVLPI